MEIRRGRPVDAPVITGFIRGMLEEIAELGGPAISTDTAPWAAPTRTIVQNLCQSDYGYFLAEDAAAHQGVVGLVAAQIAHWPAVFAPKRVLFLTAVYVVPTGRRQGIARTLLHAALTWGHQAGCRDAMLYTSVHTPARRLYERLGFAGSELKMVLPLSGEAEQAHREVSWGQRARHASHV